MAHTELQEKFLSILPRVETHGRVYFRFKDPEARDECVAEMVALAWWWFCRLAARGKDATAFPSALAGFAARAVNAGRKLAGMDRAKDVLSPRAQRIHAFYAQALPEFDTSEDNEGLDALVDSRHPSRQAGFGIDYGQYLARLGRRDRLMVVLMASGETTQDLATGFRVSPSRISQKRREFVDRWHEMHAGV